MNISVLIQEYTAGQVLAQSCRSVVPGANRGKKLPRPAYAPHLHPVGDAYSKKFCADWVKSRAGCIY